MELTWGDIYSRADLVADWIKRETGVIREDTLCVYAVPRGGIYAAQAIASSMAYRHRVSVHLVSRPEMARVVVDDLVDSGRTRTLYDSARLFVVLVDKQKEGITDWVKFPWEVAANEQGPEENIRRILEYIGEDPNREGLLETPSRVVRSYTELFSGYKYKTDEDVAKLIKVFEDGACKEMVLVKDIPFHSHCEHHMLPFNGTAHVAYLPNGRVIGLSKIPRLVEVFSRRLQVQERLTEQITAAMDLHLQPKGSACIVQGVHSCTSCRGVRIHGSSMVTSSLTGQFLEPAVRQEFYSLVGR